MSTPITSRSRIRQAEVNVLDFGADPTGVEDSTPAFHAAQDYFSAAGDSFGGTIIVPLGTFRLASSVHVKKSVTIRGTQGAQSQYASSCIQPDVGYTAFIVEAYNTPIGTTDSGTGDYALLANLFIQPEGKAPNWEASHAYAVGDVVRTGTGIGADWRRHYLCTSSTGSGLSGSASGPRSVGNDRVLDYDAQTVNFTAGRLLTGLTSGAFGTIVADADAGATGTLRLTAIVGAFVDNETISDDAGGFATANGTLAAPPIDEVDGDLEWSYIGCAAGVKLRGPATLRDVSILFCSGNGVHIEAQDTEAPAAVAIADGWRLDNVGIFHSDGHGLYCNGSDANAGLFTGGFLASNGAPTSDEDFTGTGFAIYDSSFLGNTYVGVWVQGSGRGSIFCDSIGGGSSFIGCYQEGSGGGESVVSNSTVIMGAGLSLARFAEGSTPVCIAPLGRGRGLGQDVKGLNAPLWRPNAPIPVGVQREHVGRVYNCITAGITASSGGPTTTSSNITDNTVHWEYIGEATPDGFVQLGSAQASIRAFLAMEAPSDASGVGYATYLRHGNFIGATGAIAFMYGISGAGGESGSGIMHAVNDTVLTEWPLHVPAGRAMTELLYLGGCRIAFDTAAPTLGSWNVGDRIYYKASAVSPGGAEGLICTSEGTAGTYSGGRTATTHGTTTVDLSGAAMVSLRDLQDFKVGDILSINGVTSRVQTVSVDGLTLTMGSSITAGSSLGISFHNPTFKEFGSIAI